MNALKKQQEWHSRKKKRPTLKTQIFIDLYDKRILAVAFGKGSEHEFSLLKRTFRGIHSDIVVLADRGYQVILNIHKNSWIPNKKPKKGLGMHEYTPLN